MLRCPELSKLPKATHFTSINFRRQTPGSPSTLLSPLANPYKNDRLLDPTHPAAFLRKGAFPYFRNDVIGISAYPMALLDRPSQPWQEPFARQVDRWEDRVLGGNQAGENDELTEIAPMILNNSQNNRVSMSMLSVSPKKQTSKKATIRNKLISRLKTALTLIVIRGADAEDVKGRLSLVLSEEQAKEMGDKWILKGWSYIFYPTLEIYRMPYPTLVRTLREALGKIWEGGMKMEKAWVAKSLVRLNVEKDPHVNNKGKPELSRTRTSPISITRGLDGQTERGTTAADTSLMRVKPENEAIASGGHLENAPKCDAKSKSTVKRPRSKQFGLRDGNVGVRPALRSTEANLKTGVHVMMVKPKFDNRPTTMAERMETDAMRESIALFSKAPEKSVSLAKILEKHGVRNVEEDTWKGFDDLEVEAEKPRERKSSPLRRNFFPSTTPAKPPALPWSLSASPIPLSQDLSNNTLSSTSIDKVHPPTVTEAGVGPGSDENKATTKLFHKRAIFIPPPKPKVGKR